MSQTGSIMEKFKMIFRNILDFLVIFKTVRIRIHQNESQIRTHFDPQPS